MSKKDKKQEEINNEASQNEAAQAESEYMDPSEAEQSESASKQDEMQAKIDYYIDIARRTQADFDNYRKRTISARAEAITDGKLEAVKAFLPVIDNIDRALLHAKEGDAVVEGLKLIRKQVEKTLSDLSVEEVGAIGDKFDPNLHEAVLQEPAPDGMESGVISEVFQKGYKLGDKVIRYTMVKVTE